MQTRTSDFYRFKNSQYKDMLQSEIKTLEGKLLNITAIFSSEYTNLKEKIAKYKGLLALVGNYQSISQAEMSQQQSLF